MQRALVKKGRYKDNILKICNFEFSSKSKQQVAVCLTEDFKKIVLPIEDIELIKKEVLKSTARPVGEVFASPQGRAYSKNMKSAENKPITSVKTTKTKSGIMRICESCGVSYDESSRKGLPGLIIHCYNCAEEKVTKYQGTMIYSHKTSPSIEIKQDGKLQYSAETFKYKG